MLTMAGKLKGQIPAQTCRHPGRCESQLVLDPGCLVGSSTAQGLLVHDLQYSCTGWQDTPFAASECYAAAIFSIDACVSHEGLHQAVAVCCMCPCPWRRAQRSLPGSHWRYCLRTLPPLQIAVCLGLGAAEISGICRRALSMVWLDT